MRKFLCKLKSIFFKDPFNKKEITRMMLHSWFKISFLLFIFPFALHTLNSYIGLKGISYVSNAFYAYTFFVFIKVISILILIIYLITLLFYFLEVAIIRFTGLKKFLFAEFVFAYTALSISPLIQRLSGLGLIYYQIMLFIIIVLYLCFKYYLIIETIETHKKDDTNLLASTL